MSPLPYSFVLFSTDGEVIIEMLKVIRGNDSCWRAVRASLDYWSYCCAHGDDGYLLFLEVP